jgi:ribosome-associated protein
MDRAALISELKFKAVRSGGAGGQHVNKVSTKVLLSWNLNDSKALSDEERERISGKLDKKLNADGSFQLTCDEDRSQSKNKQTAIERFLAIIDKALTIPKSRKATKVPKAAVEQRLKEKKVQGEVKQGRRKPDV